MPAPAASSGHNPELGIPPSVSPAWMDGKEKQATGSGVAPAGYAAPNLPLPHHLQEALPVQSPFQLPHAEESRSTPTPNSRLQLGGLRRASSLRKSREDVRAEEARGRLGQILSVPVASPRAEAERPSPPRIPSPPLCPFPGVNTKTEQGLRKGTELDLRKNWEVGAEGGDLSRSAAVAAGPSPAGRWAHPAR